MNGLCLYPPTLPAKPLYNTLATIAARQEANHDHRMTSLVTTEVLLITVQ